MVATTNRTTTGALVEDPERLTEVVRRATGRPDAVVATVDTRAATHQVTNMTTAALTHVSGTLVDGTTWRVFVKALHPAWNGPQWDVIPPVFHEQVLRELDWRDEPRIYTGPLAADLPDGLRLPELFRVDEEEERITLWLEDVDDQGPWDAARYQRTARLLGRLAGRWPESRTVQELGSRRRTMADLFHGKITHSDLVALADDALWASPAVRAATAHDGALRHDLRRLAEVAPALVQANEELPHALGHGDATPDNLREPTPGDVVAIDLSYAGPIPLGADLSQLLVGRFESGAATEDELDTIGGILLPAYLEGLADEGLDADPEQVEAGWATALAVRSVFSAMIVEPRDDLDEAALHQLVARRALTCRFGIDLALRVAGRLP